jgi:hypothetical protein
MKRLAVVPVVILAFVLAAGAPLTYAQARFKIPFEFEAGGKKLPQGEYTVMIKGESQIALRQLATDREVLVPVLKKLGPPNASLIEPQVVFDAVGNFEPSYTEYFTVYVLAEVWLPGHEGLQVHVTKGGHRTSAVKGEMIKK